MTLRSLARPMGRGARSLLSARVAPSVSACFSLDRAAPATVRIGGRSYATQADPPPSSPAGTPMMIGAQLRTQIESELNNMRERVLKSKPGVWLRPLTQEETELVNMGQVPGFENAEVMALLDLQLREAPFFKDRQRAGSDGMGIHVPLLAHLGSTEPEVPCYPFKLLFGQQAPRAITAVRDVIAAQRKRVTEAAEHSTKEVTEQTEKFRHLDDAPLVAVLVPNGGENRDMGMPLAISLFRLAMHEGNGHEEGFQTGGDGTKSD